MGKGSQSFIFSDSLVFFFTWRGLNATRDQKNYKHRQGESNQSPFVMHIKLLFYVLKTFLNHPLEWRLLNNYLGIQQVGWNSEE
jgi:hypothetical protein